MRLNILTLKKMKEDKINYLEKSTLETRARCFLGD
jgi:hypothetical protein